ncbi:hypothetical protein COLO4_08981 [Corchorus olitorius]|uniref:Uncharacterized protein n=1 Tax=Corchorus olitorius TaxID=93759 RepID=A0A1R3KDR1_9ROSI|nr:hypothetical protein COLO4_08981 [Corchorus olitorius]
MENNICNSQVIQPSKTVHQFYFVKFWPFKGPDEASKISEAEKLLQQLDQESSLVNDKCKMLREYLQGFNRKILHGSGNLATERKLLRDQMNGSQERVNHLINAPRPLLDAQYVIDSRWYNNNRKIDVEAKYKEMVVKIEQIEERKEKGRTDAIAKGHA